MAGTTTRTDDIMRGTTPTNSVNLGITTKCTMRCPNCTIDVPARAADGSANHVPWGKVDYDLSVMTNREPLRRVHLTGGEPTMHPDFLKIVACLAGYRDAKFIRYLTIETNGSGVRKYQDLFTYPDVFDRVFITHYVKDAIYPDNYDNTEVIAWAKTHIGDRLICEPPVTHLQKHLPLQIVEKCNGVLPCSKYFDPGLPSGWYDGLIYPCCVSVGIDRNLGILVTEDWREKVGKLDMGCRYCTYRGT